MQVSGAVGVECVLLPTGTFTVVRSVIAPTTVAWSPRLSDTGFRNDASAPDDENDSLRAELDDLEGEQSTCSWSTHGGDMNFTSLLSSLFPEFGGRVVRNLFVFQGDSDGHVRYAAIAMTTTIAGSASLEQTNAGLLLESIGEPISAIVPFRAMTKTTDESVASCDSLLIAGVRGRLVIYSSLLSSPSSSHKTNAIGRHFHHVEIAHNTAIQSITVVDSIGTLLYLTRGMGFVCYLKDLISVASGSNTSSPHPSFPLLGKFARKLPVEPNLLQVSFDASQQSVSFLFASGRVASMDMVAFNELVATVLPSDFRHDESDKSQRSTSTGNEETRVRTLLQQIEHVSTQSGRERYESHALDQQLEALHSALQVHQIYRTAGLQDLFALKISALPARSGPFSQQKSIALACSISLGVSAEVLQPYRCWVISVHIHRQEHPDEISSFTFPLANLCRSAAGITLTLNPRETKVHQGGVLLITSQLLFHTNEHISTTHDGSVCAVDNDESSLFALSIPIGSPQQVLLVQMSEPVVDKGSESGPTLSGEHAEEIGVRWWSSLAAYAPESDIFDKILSKVALSLPDKKAQQDLSTMSTPSRFTMKMPLLQFGGNADADRDQVAQMFTLLGRLFPGVEPSALRKSSRVIHGSKIWTTLRTLAGNLLLLKMHHTGDDGGISIVLQCSDVGELSAMRAMVLTTMNEGGHQEHDPHEVNKICGRLSSALGSHLATIVGVEVLAKELIERINRTLRDPESSDACTDEILHSFAQLTSLEIQVLDVYWKTRQVLDKVNL